jgi:hypothetical protein
MIEVEYRLNRAALVEVESVLSMKCGVLPEEVLLLLLLRMILPDAHQLTEIITLHVRFKLHHPSVSLLDHFLETLDLRLEFLYPRLLLSRLSILQLHMFHQSQEAVMSGDLRSHQRKCALGACHSRVLAILLEVPFKLSLFEALLASRVVCAPDLILSAVEVQVVVQEPSLNQLVAR